MLWVTLTLAGYAAAVTVLAVVRGRRLAAAHRTTPAAVPAPASAAARETPTRTATSPRLPEWRNHVRGYQFPPRMLEQALARCPDGTDARVVEQGLRQFFLACGEAPDLRAAMPSKCVDEAWHEFLTFTRDYADFCDRAFGRMLHHVPESTMSAAELGHQRTDAMLAAWDVACEESDLDPYTTETAPALFAADPDGVTYLADCGRPECPATDDQVCIAHRYRTPIAQRSAHETPAGSLTDGRARTRHVADDGYRDAGAGAALLAAAMMTAPDPGPTDPNRSSCGSSTGCGSSAASCSSSGSSSSCGSSGSSCGGGCGSG